MGTRVRLESFYRRGYAYAKAASAFLGRLSNLSPAARREIWDGRSSRLSSHGTERSTVPGHWFGPYSGAHLRFVRRTFRLVVRRFEHGFDMPDGARPVHFACLDGSYGRCQQGLLGNASIYGTIRVCPRLLEKPVAEGGVVVLHEMLHQELFVGDQRDRICRVGTETRCYRDGARRLVRAGKVRKAILNNDNYAFFAKHVFLASRARSDAARAA
jgi:hypothetical protein